MRLGLHGLGSRDTAVAPWPSLIAALGDGAEVVALDARLDAILVYGALAGHDAQTVLAFARTGGPVLGLGEGFQALCGIGLLPGCVTAPADDDGSANAHVRVEGRATPFTSAIPAGRVVRLDGAAATGLGYEIAEPQALEARGQVIFRYCDPAGGPVTPTLSPPGGSARATTAASQLRLSSVPLIPPRVRSRAIAGVCGEAGNVVGILAAATAIHTIGAQLLGSLRMHLRGKR